MSNTRNIALGLSVCTAIALSAPAMATIIAWNGDIFKILPPPSVLLDDLEHNSQLHAFDELEACRTLKQPIVVEGEDGFELLIPAGVPYECNFFHADPTNMGAKNYKGRARFDGNIISILTEDIQLDATDDPCTVLDSGGSPRTDYPTGVAGRGIGALAGEGAVAIGLNEVEIRMSVGSTEFDQVRVITECDDTVVGGDTGWYEE